MIHPFDRRTNPSYLSKQTNPKIMSHFGRAGPPDIRDTYSLLVLNITFRTTADDLFPLFDKYGKVVDVFIPRDRRTGDSRGFAFVRYKYADEAQKAVDKLDGRVVDGREIMVQFAKYGPDAERIHKGRIVEPVEKFKVRSRSRSPRPSSRYRDDYRDRDYRRRNRSRSRDRDDYERRGRDRDRYRSRSRDRDDYERRGRDRDRYRSRSRSRSPDYRKERRRGRHDDDRGRSRSPNRSVSPAARDSVSPRKSLSPRRTPSRSRSPVARDEKERSPTPKSVSPRGRSNSRSPSPQRSDADE